MAAAPQPLVPLLRYDPLSDFVCQIRVTRCVHTRVTPAIPPPWRSSRVGLERVIDRLDDLPNVIPVARPGFSPLRRRSSSTSRRRGSFECLAVVVLSPSTSDRGPRSSLGSRRLASPLRPSATPPRPTAAHQGSAAPGAASAVAVLATRDDRSPSLASAHTRRRDTHTSSLRASGAARHARSGRRRAPLNPGRR